MAATRNVLLPLFIHISEIFERSLGQLILTVAELGLFPSIIGVVISFSRRRFVLLDWSASLISGVFWLLVDVDHQKFGCRQTMRVMLRPRRLCTLPLGLLDETAHFLSLEGQRRLFPFDIVGDIIVYWV